MDNLWSQERCSRNLLSERNYSEATLNMEVKANSEQWISLHDTGSIPVSTLCKSVFVFCTFVPEQQGQQFYYFPTAYRSSALRMNKAHAYKMLLDKCISKTCFSNIFLFKMKHRKSPIIKPFCNHEGGVLQDEAYFQNCL